MHRYRFALRPRWILSHGLIAILVVVMINLGFWQLRRLHDRRAENSRIESHEALPEAPVNDVLHPGDPYANASGVAFRKVTATGTYDTSNEILIRQRSL